MPLIRLINPNTSTATTGMMTAIARAVLPPGFEIEGVTAERGVAMIVNAAQLAQSERQVEAMALSGAANLSGIVISAFGDPAIDRVRERATCPVVGICEASMIEASAGDRRFGIATVTPDLADSFSAKARSLGIADRFTGTRLTEGDPERLAGDAAALEDALLAAVERCFGADGADAVIIGGGPLGQAALTLQARFDRPVIAPIPSAIALLLARIAGVTAE